MKSIEQQIFHTIKSRGRGCVFFGGEFTDKFNSVNLDKALSNLAKEKKIRRVIRGIYDFPKYSKLLDQYLSPEINKIAYTLARKFRWKIEPSGGAALYFLGLSTQVPARYIYFSNGPNREYEIYGNKLEFKKIALKEVGFKYAESAILVQSLKSLGKEHITLEILKKMRAKTVSSLRAKIIQDTKTVSSWIYDAIKQICKESDL